MHLLTSCLVALTVLAGGIRQVNAEAIMYSWSGYIEAIGGRDPWQCGGDGYTITPTDGKPFEFSVTVDVESPDRAGNPDSANFWADSADLMIDGRRLVVPDTTVYLYFKDDENGGSRDKIGVFLDASLDGFMEKLSFEVRIPTSSFTLSPGPYDPPPYFTDTIAVENGMGIPGGATYLTYVLGGSQITTQIVPEPSALVLLGLGAAGVAGIWRSRRRNPG